MLKTAEKTSDLRSSDMAASAGGAGSVSLVKSPRRVPAEGVDTSKFTSVDPAAVSAGPSTLSTPSDAPVAENLTPPCVYDLPGVKQFRRPPIACVYLLCRKGEVVYVGQTIDLARRIQDHTIKKTFDEVYYITAKRRVRRVLLEADLIDKFNPRLNRNRPWKGNLPSAPAPRQEGVTS